MTYVTTCKHSNHVMNTIIPNVRAGNLTQASLAWRLLETRLKEHKDICAKCLMDKSAVAKHVWTNNHPINWAKTKIL